MVDDELLDLVEIEVRELLTTIGFDGCGTPVVRGSASLALNGDKSYHGIESVKRLINAIDEHVKIPTRDYNSPFLLPIDNAINIPGRGTVVIGTLKRGIMKKNSNADLLGFNNDIKTSVSDIQVILN